jgi:subfamily B ATP-binding cassette protein MsbA
MISNIRSDISVLYSIVRRFKKPCCFLFLFLALDVALETLSVGSIIPTLTVILNKSVPKNGAARWVLNTFSDLSESKQVMWFGVSIMALFFIRTANNLATKFYSSWFTNYLREYWSGKTFWNLLNCDSFYLKSLKKGVVNNTINQEPFFAAKGINLLVDVIISGLFMISLTALLFFINWKVTFVCCVILFLFVFAIWNSSMQFSTEMGRRRIGLNEEISQLSSDFSDGWRQIRVLSIEKELYSEFQLKLRKLVTGLTKFDVVNGVPKEIGELSIVCVIIAGLFFSKFIKNVELSLYLPEIVFFSLSFMKLFSAATVVLKKGMEVANCLPSIIKVQSFSEMAHPEKPVVVKATPFFQRNLSVKNLGFKFPKGHSVFSELSFKIQKGETVALFGRSGVGKSTLCDLLAGLIKPSTGAILIDGIPLAQLEETQWRSRIAYVTQEVFLFNDTVIKNILKGSNHSSRELAIKASENAQAREFIELLPQGFDTLLGPGGINLSGGQKQRIALAQALVRDPEFLILDESTSALDYQSEEKILNALSSEKGKRTVIIVTHRLHALKFVDRVLYLQSDSIKELKSLSEVYGLQNVDFPGVSSLGIEGTTVQLL